MDKSLENTVEEVIKRQKKRLPLWLKWVLEILTMLIVVPVLIFQIPWVQSKAAQKLTAYLSKEWKTEVSVGKVALGIFNSIKLDDVYIEDLAGDTLLYAGHLQVNHSGIFMLPFRQFKIESAQLENTDIYIHRADGEMDENFQFIIDYFTKEPPKEKKTACYADRWCFAVVDQAKNYESAKTFLVYYSKWSLSKNFKKQHGVFPKIEKLKNPKILNIKEEVLLKNMSF